MIRPHLLNMMSRVWHLGAQPLNVYKRSHEGCNPLFWSHSVRIHEATDDFNNITQPQ